jgi:hypothetical protein
MNPRVAAWLDLSLWALAVVFASLMGLFYLLSLSAWGEVPDRAPSWFAPLMALMLVSFSTVGAVIAARRPDSPYGWLWLGFGLVWALLSFAGSYAEYAAASGKLPAPGTVAVAGGVVWVAGGALTPLLMLLFPDGRLPSPRWRFLVWTVLAAGVVSVVLGLFMPGQGIASVENPFGVGGRVGEVIFALIATGCS